MTKEEKMAIIDMRQAGRSYGEMARELDMPVNTIKAFCHRYEIKKIEVKEALPKKKPRPETCKKCGEPLVQNKEGRMRKFCSPECRKQWWKENDDQYDRKAYYKVVCHECGKVFDSYGNKTRKFCSHPCYIKYRFEGGQVHDQRSV